MSHTWSHNVRHNVTPRGRNAGRTIGVTLLQTRPDQTRVSRCGFAFGVVASIFQDQVPNVREGI